MKVIWGSYISNGFHVSNGVKQGGILSPLLFHIYVNNLSIALNSSIYGCCAGFMRANHILYADDICILASSPFALQKLLHMCCDYANKNDISFNAKKSKIMIFQSRFNATVYNGCFNLDSVGLERVNDFKYPGHSISDDCGLFYSAPYIMLRLIC